METKHLSAKEAMELAVQKREKELSLDVIMESIRERDLNGFDYWMTFGVVTEKEEKFLRDNGYRISRFGNGCVQVYWKPKQA